MNKPLAIDLYAGLGGWTEGLLAEGWEVIGFDIERHEYGDAKYPGHLILQDVRTIDGAKLRNADLIVGSSPCQEFSYRAMPWKRAKELGPPVLGIELFKAQFRIQQEACVAKGRHVPMVVENVRGAQPWVGRSRWNYSSWHLWGDVPALMPKAFEAKQAGISGVRTNGKGDGWFENGAARHGSKSQARKRHDREDTFAAVKVDCTVLLPHRGCDSCTIRMIEHSTQGDSQ